MIKFFYKEYFILLLIICPAVLFSAVVFRSIYPLHFNSQTLLFFDLLGYPASLPIWSMYIFGCADIILIWLIGKLILNGRWRFLPVIIFGFSPWFIYSVVAGSFYIYILFLLLVSFLGFYLTLICKQRFTELIFIIGSVLLLYSSIVIFLTYLLFLSGLFFRLIQSHKIKRSLVIILIICLPLIFMMFRNTVGIKNILNNQVNFLSDPGIKNNINMFQGESKKEGFGYLSKLGENKYLYILRYMILKLTQNLVPSTFFTPKEKLLGFSFAPPIYLGLMIPFMYGFYLLLNFKKLRRYLLLSLVLIIPSFVSEKMVDLNRLILFEPVIIFITAYGLRGFLTNQKPITKIILFSSLILVLLQFLAIASDINFREYPRFERYKGIAHWQMDKQ